MLLYKIMFRVGTDDGKRLIFGYLLLLADGLEYAKKLAISIIEEKYKDCKYDINAVQQMSLPYMEVSW